MSTSTSDYIIRNTKPVYYCLLLLLVHVTVDEQNVIYTAGSEMAPPPANTAVSETAPPPANTAGSETAPPLANNYPSQAELHMSKSVLLCNLIGQGLFSEIGKLSHLSANFLCLRLEDTHT